VIVFPMNGRGQRFVDAGYRQPKFMLELAGTSVFRHVLEGFASLFGAEQFLFVMAYDTKIAAFVESECAAMGLTAPLLAILNAPTRGQAETVALGLEQAATDPTEPLTIFNIDTLRPNFAYPKDMDLSRIDGYLEVFKCTGDGWSFVRPDSGIGGRVAETAEKKRISDLCCSGLYHFRSASLFTESFEAALGDADWPLVNGEYYVAPLYNRLIANARDIRYHLITDTEVAFCGTPEQYAELTRQMENDHG
jgi:hypothetical protein